MNIKYGMILAAGLGKRMQPLTLKNLKLLFYKHLSIKKLKKLNKI